jgi:hypothetical protein
MDSFAYLMWAILKKNELLARRRRRRNWGRGVILSGHNLKHTGGFTDNY